MKNRCNNRNNPKYQNYGGRGITICERWRDSFENFLADMGERPEGKTLDRIDPNGNYEPGNCRWADRATQNRNRVNNWFIEHEGRRLCLADWATELGYSPSTIRNRLEKQWPLEKALQPHPNKKADIPLEGVSL